MNKLFINNISDLIEIQRASFYKFLYSGITQELTKISNPIKAKIFVSKNKKVESFIFLYPSSIKLKGPKYGIKACLEKDLTYSIQIYVLGQYYYQIDKNSKKVNVKQDIFLGEIPLMTEEGTFIINGCERVIISQIIRSPGVYFRKEFNASKQPTYTATIISDKGLWTKIMLENLKNKNLNNFKEQICIKIVDNNIKTKQKVENKINLYDFIHYFGLTFKEFLDELKLPLILENYYSHNNEYKIQKTISSINNILFVQFSIGEIGRYKLNKKFNLNIPQSIEYLTIYDILKIINNLIELKYGNLSNDDIDDLKNKQIRSIGQLLQNQIKIGFYRLQKKMIEEGVLKISLKKKNSEKNNIHLNNYKSQIIDPRNITSTVKEFFNTSQLSQYMDQINPLSGITHKRKISLFGPNGLKRDNIINAIRDIHPSQYGRLCPIDTPEGQNAGLISSLSLFSRVDSFGFINSPYLFISKNRFFPFVKPIYFNSKEESKLSISFSDTLVNKDLLIENRELSVKENYNFLIKKSNSINYIITSPLQIISLSTALIPFLEHDDANRVLMGSNMQRQAVPLLYSQKSIVGTGFEAIPLLSSEIVIKNYSEGFILFVNSLKIIVIDKFGQKLSYFLKKYNRSNQDTCINQKPIVWNNELVYSGQIIADGSGTIEGELALGRNLTLAYMPWEGYNYEDAIIINESLVLNDVLTSIHIEEIEINLNFILNNSEKLTKCLKNKKSTKYNYLNKSGIVKIGTYVKEYDILIGKLSQLNEDIIPEYKLLQALYFNENRKKEPIYKETSFCVPQGIEGRVIDIRLVKGLSQNKDEKFKTSFCEKVRVYIAQVRKIKIGDKLAGRHGNKGIISKILSQQDMPYLPDGTSIDIILNPLGVPSRMNVGQIFESLLGFAGEKLGRRFKITPFDEIYGQEASRLLITQKLKQSSYVSNSDWIYNSLYPGKIFIRDGRTGEFFDNPVTIGKSYILKLIHLVEDKINARATGPYSLITEQPLAGKSKKGGQRFGEMEVWALEAYGAANTLQEMLTIKSDDIDGRNDMYKLMLTENNFARPYPSIPESFIALIRELNSLGLDCSFYKFTNEFSITSNFLNLKKDFFKEFEIKLKLRNLLSKKRVL